MHCMLYATLTLGWALSAFGMTTQLRFEADSFRSAHVTLTDRLDSIGSPVLTFRVDIHESQEPCDNPNVSIDGQTLRGPGHGMLTLEHDVSIFAHWEFACVIEEGAAPKVLLIFRVYSLEGECVHYSQLILSFRQIVPPIIIGIQGPASLTPIQKPGTRIDDDEAHNLQAEPTETPEGVQLQHLYGEQAKDAIAMRLGRQNQCVWLHGYVNGVNIFDRCVSMLLINILGGLVVLVFTIVWRVLRHCRRLDENDNRGYIWRNVERQNSSQGQTRHNMQHYVDEKMVCEKEAQCTDPAQEMADEISSFRMAADLVQDMVNAEIARSQ